MHRLAVLTACVALVPITVGALVTTLQAGMAFLDWPSSDGHNMFFYPWIESFALADKSKAVEHGHRLGGILIGLLSIGLTAWALRWESRRWVRIATVVILLGVIGQGVLGGVRVLFDSSRFALVHGSFAALVFALMCGVALVTSRSWFSEPQRFKDRDVGHLKPVCMLLLGLICAQYVLGGLLRHEGRALYEHIGFGALVTVMALALGVLAQRTGIRWLRRPGWLLIALVVIQFSLGVSAFVTKFGWAQSGYVAVYGSMAQIVIRTSHTIVGMLLFVTSVNISVRVFWLDRLHLAETASTLVAEVAKTSGGRPLASHGPNSGESGYMNHLPQGGLS